MIPDDDTVSFHANKRRSYRKLPYRGSVAVEPSASENAQGGHFYAAAQDREKTHHEECYTYLATIKRLSEK